MGRDYYGRLNYVTTILIVALVFMIAFVPARLIKRGGAGENVGTYRTLTGSSSYEVRLAGSGFAYYDGATLAYMSGEGELKWTYMLGSGAQFTASEYGIAAWTGNYLTLIDTATGVTLYSDAQEADVLSAKVSSKFACVLLGETDNSYMNVMEHGGRIIFKNSFVDCTVLDYGFYSGGTLMWVMSLDTTGTAPDCSVTTYKPGSMKVVGSITDNEQMMYHASFYSTDVYCVGVEKLKVYSYSSKELKDREKLVYGFYLAASEDRDDPLMAFVPAQQYEKSAMRDLRLIRSDCDRFIRMPFDCTDICVKGDTVAGVSTGGQLMLAKAGRQTVNSYQLPFTVEKAYGITDDGYLVASSGGSIYIISIGLEK